MIEYLASGVFRLETNRKRLVFSISRSFSSRSPFCCSFLPLDTVMQRTAGSTNPRWRDTTMSGIYYLNPLSNDPRLFFFARAAIWARSWLSFFPISPTCRHHVVTDDVPLRCRFFCDGRLSRVTLVSPRPNECMLYASVLSLRVRYHYLCNDKKNPEHYIKHFSHEEQMERWRNFVKARYFTCPYFIKNNEVSLSYLPTLRYNFYIVHCLFYIFC